MAKTKVAVTLDREVVDSLDRLVKEAAFPSRSQGIQIALQEKLQRMARGRLARECAKPDPAEERSLAERGFSVDASEWPEC